MDNETKLGNDKEKLVEKSINPGDKEHTFKNIKKIGESISGLGIYKFNYIGQVKQYIGAMADEVIKVVTEAVSTMSNGYFGVRYDLIDVQFKEVNP